MMTHIMFMATSFETNGYISKLFDLPGFQFEYIDIDLMHCSDLGVKLYHIACCLYDMLKEIGTNND